MRPICLLMVFKVVYIVKSGKNISYILIKDKLIDLIERTFNRKGSPYIACNDRNFGKPKKYHAWSC